MLSIDGLKAAGSQEREFELWGKAAHNTSLARMGEWWALSFWAVAGLMGLSHTKFWAIPLVLGIAAQTVAFIFAMRSRHYRNEALREEDKKKDLMAWWLFHHPEERYKI